MKKILLFCLMVLASVPVYAGSWESCVGKIKTDGRFVRMVTDLVSNKVNINNDQSKKNELRQQLAALMFDSNDGLCNEEIVDIARLTSPKLSVVVNNKKYTFVIDIDKLFDVAEVQTAIMVYPGTQLSLFDEVNNSSIKSSPWRGKCSRQWVSGNFFTGNTAVSDAAEAIFGKGSTYFLDFEKGNNQRVFPGLLIGDINWSANENIIIMRHLPTALKKVEAFAKNLQNSECANKGLSVYLVSIAGTPQKKVGKTGAAVVGIASVAVPLIGSIVAATAVGATAVGGAIAAVGGPVGWIVGGAIALVGGAIALIPTDLADIETVYVLDGPYTIR